MSETPQLRHFANDGPVQSLAKPPRHYIIQGLQKLVDKYPPESKSFLDEEQLGLFAGPTSIAYLFFTLSRRKSYEDLRINDRSLHQWGEAYLDCAVKSYKPGGGEIEETSEGRQGIIYELPSQLAIKAAFLKDERALQELLALMPEVLKDGEVFNEHIYGRTGYLFLLRMVRTFWPEADIPPEAFKQVIDRVMLDGPEKWKCAGAYYAGAGHGWMVIILQILLTDASYAGACKEALVEILDNQILDESDDDYGNWDAFLKRESAKEKRIQIQWGHGAPGIVISLQSLLPIYEKTDPDLAARMQAAIDRAQGVIWRKGLLRKESCPCHGAAGNMFALLDQKQREHFMAFSTEEVVERGLADGSLEASSSPSGLYRGLAGRIWAFAELEAGTTHYPAYNEL